MRTLLLALLLTAGASTIATAQTADKAAAKPSPSWMAPLNQFIDGVNKNDEASAAAAFVASPFIIDEVPPHSWQGKTAFHDWFQALGADGQKHKQTDNLMKLGKATYVVVSGPKAYVVIQGFYTYKQEGTPLHENGKLVFGLAKGKDGWKIDGVAWSGVVPAK